MANHFYSRGKFFRGRELRVLIVEGVALRGRKTHTALNSSKAKQSTSPIAVTVVTMCCAHTSGSLRESYAFLSLATAHTSVVRQAD
jgi:hypothetical protein